MALLIRNHTMSLSLYDLSVPVFTQSLQALDVVLTKGEAHAAAKKIDLGVFLTARLAPDMFTFTRQVQLATDFAKGGAARIAGVDVPKYEDVEASFAETLSVFGRVDSCFANAGVARSGRFDETTTDDWRAVLDVNLDGLFYTLRAAAGHMRARAEAGRGAPARGRPGIPGPRARLVHGRRDRARGARGGTGLWPA